MSRRGDEYNTLRALLGGLPFAQINTRIAESAGSFVFRPGAPVPIPPIFDDWSELYAATQVTSGLPRVIRIDDTIVSPAVIPAGSYSLRNATFTGAPHAPNAQCVLADGVTMSGFTEVFGSLTLTSQSTAAVVTLSDSELVLIDRGANISSAPGAAPFFRVVAGANPIIPLILGGQLGSGAGDHVLQVDAGGNVGVILDLFAALQNDVMQGAGNGQVIVASMSAYANTPRPILQPGMPGLNVMEFFFAEMTHFLTPLAAGNWAGAAPTDVDSAIERLATAVSGILGAPIP